MVVKVVERSHSLEKMTMFFCVTALLFLFVFSTSSAVPFENLNRPDTRLTSSGSANGNNANTGNFHKIAQIFHGSKGSNDQVEEANSFIDGIIKVFVEKYGKKFDPLRIPDQRARFEQQFLIIFKIQGEKRYMA